MKFLIDNALSPVVATELQKAGHEASHVRDHHLQTASDEEIFEFATLRDEVIVSADTDFGMLLALRQETKPSFILFRRTSKRRPHEQAALLLANLSSVSDALQRGCIVVIEETRIRVRSLPIGGQEDA